MNEEKAKKYDSTHGKDAYHYRHTKAGQGQSKAYDAYFNQSKSKSKALHKAGEEPSEYNHKEIAKNIGKGKQLYPHQEGKKTIYR